MCSEVGKSVSSIISCFLFDQKHVSQPDNFFSLQYKHDSRDMRAELVVRSGFGGGQLAGIELRMVTHAFDNWARIHKADVGVKNWCNFKSGRNAIHKLLSFLKACVKFKYGEIYPY